MISDLKSSLALRVGQKQPATYFDRICGGVDKQIGERTHKFRLDDAEFLNEDMSPDNLILKRSIEGFIEKLDVVS